MVGHPLERMESLREVPAFVVKMASCLKIVYLQEDICSGQDAPDTVKLAS